MKYRLFLFTVLASVGFFNPLQILSPGVKKAMFVLAIMVSFFYCMQSKFSLKGVKFPRITYGVLMAGLLFSVIMSSAFHMQGLRLSAMATLPYILGYLFFFIMLRLDIPEEKVIKTYIWLSFVSAAMYFVNLMYAPHNLFGDAMLEGEDITRGILRLPIFFIEMFPLLLFYSINRLMLTKNRKWMYYIIFLGVMIVLSVIRQVILLSAVLGIFMYMQNVSWKKKFLMVAAVVAVVVWVLPMIPVYNAMMELSEEQRDKNEDEEDIRIQSWRYYTYENQTNGITPFFGNGVPSYGNSAWGTMMESETDDNKCYDTDVGWAGFFWHFGLIATVALLLLILKGIFKHKNSQHQYITYWLLFVMLTSVASGLILYFFQIINICTVLYLAFRWSDSNITTTVDKNETETKRDTVAKPRFPQLKKAT